MRLHNIVNGEKIEMLPEEEKETLERWAIAEKLMEEKRLIPDYPPISEQLDYMYHNGFDKWVALIKSIKDKRPKSEGIK